MTTHVSSIIEVDDLDLTGLAPTLVSDIRELMTDIAQEAYNEGYADGYAGWLMLAGVASVQ